MTSLVNIGRAAVLTGVSAKMIRHYEEQGLLSGINRTEAGYRLYSETELQQLRFISQSRKLGFPMAQIKELLQFFQDKQRASREVKALAQAHLSHIEQKIAELSGMKQDLQQLIAQCAGDDGQQCAILDGLTCCKQ